MLAGFKCGRPTLANISYTAYHPTGSVKATWGSQTYPTWNVYDEQNRQTQLHTWKVAPALTLATIPADPPSGSEITTWIYGPSTGHLVEKNYPGESDNGTTDADYAYTPGGRLFARISERGITTTYGYTHGLMTSTDYSDTTPDVTIHYEPLGRRQSISTSVAKSEFIYDPVTLDIDMEAISYDLDAVPGYDFFRQIDRKPTSLGRDKGFDLKDGNTLENQALYGYSLTDGRLVSVGRTDISPASFSYGYTPNSNLLETVTGPVHTVTNSWESNRDVLDIKQNKVGTFERSKYDYAVNAIGQRTGVITSGSAFPNVPSWLWGYDGLGQVVSADSSVSTSDRAYEYDAIGNRKKSANSLTLPGSDNYITNALNQYSTIGNPQSAIVNPSYDLDGNATDYPLPVSPTTHSTLIWDAENRLIEVKNSVGTTLEKNVFDSGSRKIATIANGVTTLYLYDAWNCIAEYEVGTGVPPVLKKTRLWGSDLSGSMQGAGGVGGLLSETHVSAAQSPSYYPAYDGNGNISEYLDSSGQVAAHFEYDPFGNTVVNTDSSNQFAYRFSTKPLAFATGLYYYAYRYYDPVTGRWPSRDPIEEEGGENLYGFVGNDGVNMWDYLGKYNYNPYITGSGHDDKGQAEGPTFRAVDLGLNLDQRDINRVSDRAEELGVCDLEDGETIDSGDLEVLAIATNQMSIGHLSAVISGTYTVFKQSSECGWLFEGKLDPEDTNQMDFGPKSHHHPLMNFALSLLWLTNPATSYNQNIVGEIDWSEGGNCDE